jgi:hypothetical protein
MAGEIFTASYFSRRSNSRALVRGLAADWESKGPALRLGRVYRK